MEAHKFKTNQLGYTYNEYGINLYKQLNLNYIKLYGQEAKTIVEPKPKNHPNDD